MRRNLIRISDHAMIRFLERVGGLDVEAIRYAMARSLDEAARLGAAVVVIDGFRYILREDDSGPVLVTVEPKSDTNPVHRRAHRRDRPLPGEDEA